MSPFRLLLAEDSPDDAAVMIQSLGVTLPAHNIIHCVDGEQAMDCVNAKGAFTHLAGQLPPDLILLDMTLPKISGLELLLQLRAHEATRLTPIVMISSSRNPADIRQAFKLGANSYVTKPVELGRFRDAITRLSQYWIELNLTPTRN